MATAIGCGAGFVWLAVRLFRTDETKAMKKAGRSLFTYSLSYLFLVFFALIVDHAAQLLGWI
jgi:protoheme IX farnesyltransferase